MSAILWTLPTTSCLHLTWPEEIRGSGSYLEVLRTKVLVSTSEPVAGSPHDEALLVASHKECMVVIPPMTIIKRKRLDVVLPAFNEEANLKRVVMDLLSASWPDDFDVFAIVVDDGSTDATLEVARRLASESSRVSVLHHARNIGYGGAVADGIAHASGDFVAIMDADGQFSPDDLIRLCVYLSDYDIVVGHRVKRADPGGRRFLGSTGSLLARLLFQTRLQDLNCGLKVFRRVLLEPLQLRCRGPGINLEILALLAKHHPRVKEVAVGHSPRSAGAQTGGRFRTLVRLLPESLSVLWRCRFQRTMRP